MAHISQSTPGSTIKLYLSLFRAVRELKKFHLISFSFTFQKESQHSSRVTPHHRVYTFLLYQSAPSSFSPFHCYADDTQLYLPPTFPSRSEPLKSLSFLQIKRRNVFLPITPPHLSPRYLNTETAFVALLEPTLGQQLIAWDLISS